MKHTHNVVICENQFDTFGHLNNAKYLELYEQARWDLLNQRGYTLETIRRLQQGPVILSIQIDFRRELTAPMPIRITTEMLSYIGKIFVLEQKMLDGEDIVCSKCTLKGGLFDLRQRNLVAPNQQWLKVFNIEWREKPENKSNEIRL